MAPGELALTDEYRVSRYTAARALDLLASSGLIDRRPGVGSVVMAGHDGEIVTVRPGTRITVRVPRPGAGQWEPVLVVDEPGTDSREVPAIGTTVIVDGAAGRASDEAPDEHVAGRLGIKRR